MSRTAKSPQSRSGLKPEASAESRMGEFDVDVANALLDGGRDTALGVFSECGLHP